MPVTKRVVPVVQSQTYVRHDGCPNAEQWRKANEENGFPYFKPDFHQRYDEAQIFLVCEGCDTHIALTTRFDNNLESY